MSNHHIGLNTPRPTEYTQQKDLSTMANYPLEATQSFYGREQLDFWRKLDKKREKINAEIASFKKVKEQEYQDYEKQLSRDLYKEEVADSENGDDGKDDGEDDVENEVKDERARENHEDLLYRQHAELETSGDLENMGPARNNRRKHRRSITPTAPATPPDSQQSRQVDGAQPEEGESTPSSYGSTKILHDTAPTLSGVPSTNHSTSSPEGSPRPSTTASVPHDREKVFDSVFTSNFLPLIDTTCGHSNSNESSLHPEISEPSEIATAMDSSPSLHHQLSSSAEYYHDAGMTSPPAGTARQLSSSVPPENEGLGHRRSSSASGEEGSRRRSSLRRPNSSGPKSPKRVLFSIDDNVVSPSTSPIAKREKENTRPPRKTRVLEADKYQVVRNKPLKQPSANGAGILASSLSGVSASATGWTSDVSPLRWAMNGGGAKQPSPDDFVDVEDENDMFSFDEEMRAQVKKQEGAGSKLEGKFGRDIDDDEEMEVEKPLTGSSPHAGSLPIEIKWPGRKESGGEE